MPGIDLLNTDAWAALLLATALKGAVVILAALLATRFLTKAAASTRHAIWVFAFIAALAMPVLLVAVPGWEIPILPEEGLSLGLSEEVTMSVPSTSTETLVAGISGTTAGAPSAQETTISVALLLLLFWGIGAFFVATRWFAGVLSAWVLIRRSPRLQSEGWSDAARVAGEALNLRRPVDLRISPYTRTPMTWGIFRPVVLLPEESEWWPADRRAVVITHELAHVRRLDSVTQLFAQAACVLHWFNPFAWKAYQRFLIEREHACDDFVLNDGMLPSSYAEHLLDIAKSLRRQPRAEYVMAPMAQRSQIEERLRSILNDQQRRDRLSRGLLVVVCTLVFALVWPVAAVNFVAKGQQAASEPVPPAPPEPPLPPVAPAPPTPPNPQEPPAPPAPEPAPMASADLGVGAESVFWVEQSPSGPAPSEVVERSARVLSADFDRKRRDFQVRLDAALAYEIDAEEPHIPVDVTRIVVELDDDEWDALVDETRSVVRRVDALARDAREWASSDWIDAQGEVIISVENETEAAWTAHWKDEVRNAHPQPTINPVRVESEDICTRDRDDTKRTTTARAY